MKRTKVYELIDGERDYQNGKPPRPQSDADTPVSAWLLYISHQLQEANEAIYFLDREKALEGVRKIAALAVACMEHNETNPRN